MHAPKNLAGNVITVDKDGRSHFREVSCHEEFRCARLHLSCVFPEAAAIAKLVKLKFFQNRNKFSLQSTHRSENHKKNNMTRSDAPRRRHKRPSRTPMLRKNSRRNTTDIIQPMRSRFPTVKHNLNFIDPIKTEYF